MRAFFVGLFWPGGFVVVATPHHPPPPPPPPGSAASPSSTRCKACDPHCALQCPHYAVAWCGWWFHRVHGAGAVWVVPHHPQARRPLAYPLCGHSPPSPLALHEPAKCGTWSRMGCGCAVPKRGACGLLASILSLLFKLCGSAFPAPPCSRVCPGQDLH